MSSPPFKVKAVYEYTSPHDDDLHFPNGQIITVTEVEDDDWYVGEYLDASGVKQEGLFPQNFVEKYEPTAPPRPARASRPKKEAEPSSATTSQPPLTQSAAEPEHEPELEQEPEPPVVQQPVTRRGAPPSESSAATELPPSPVEAPAAPVPQSADWSKAPAPPPVVEKPSSFRDRIAAFNKAAPPVAPFKPSGLGSGGGSSFIKKPFVAPPPSKNAYVPTTPREPPPKIYRREEDPEIAAKEAENLEQAERVGLAPSQNEDQEDQPKPTSLKDRIALLQKQQMEQAARHADAAQRKEKPKKPTKKKPETSIEGVGAPVLDRNDMDDTIGRPSTDSTQDEVAAPRRRKSMATTPGFQPRKSFGDGNEADMSGAGDTTEEPEESTGRDDSVEPPKHRLPVRAPDVGEEEGATEEPQDEVEKDDLEEQEQGEEVEEEEDIDPEVRRKEELRARMAKMSGGMGMGMMFGMPMTSAPAKKKGSSGTSERTPAGESAQDSAPAAAQVPMIPMPGMSTVKSPEDAKEEEEEEPARITASRRSDEVPDIEDVVEPAAPPPVFPPETGAPPVPGGRPAPPPIPRDSRPPPSTAAPHSPRSGSESDDEMSIMAQKMSTTSTMEESQAHSRPSNSKNSPNTPGARRTSSFFVADEGSPSAPITPNTNKRTSRAPPPIPGAANASQGRGPPPPPPTSPPGRAPTNDLRLPSSPRQPQVEEEEVTEYEGDYDTDIASAAPHKEALKTAKESEDTSVQSSALLSSPPMPPARNVPPPLPSQPPPRRSADVPRAAPPPPPQSKAPAPQDYDDDEYDPYKYGAPTVPAPKAAVPVTKAPTAPSKAPPKQPAMQHSVTIPTAAAEFKEDDLYEASPPRSHTMPIQDWTVPQPAAREHAPAPSRAPPKQSLDISRSATTGGRRSTELGRLSMDSGFVANDIDLALGSHWWTKPRGVPPAFQNRKDILTEFEETTSKRGGQSIIREVFILFQDYSQTVITIRFDPQHPNDAKLEQRHEQAPARLRQDQLEAAYERFSARINDDVGSKKETVVGDGSPHSLIIELLRPFPDALPPVGVRAYGAIVYANLANASTSQNDEIRPGDIITLRNTKFQGKHGAMHAKYSVEVGRPDHVGIVAEWDGTKKKVRAWEQGRESRKVKMESYKLDDLRSGEVKIWRVMGREWVGWNSGGN